MATPEEAAGIPEDAVAILHRAVASTEDIEAFEAGYFLTLVKEHDAEIRFRATGRVAIDLKMPNPCGTWLEDRTEEDGVRVYGQHLIVEKPAFVLGGITAAFGLVFDKADAEAAEPPVRPGLFIISD
jgi:hypothetical protein